MIDRDVAIGLTKLVKRLISRTQEEKVKWAASRNVFDMGTRYKFSTSSATIIIEDASQLAAGTTIKIQDERGEEVVSFTATPVVPFVDPWEADLTDAVRKLYGIVHEKTLEVNKIIDKIGRDLDEM
jgi:hypothetical protein